MKVQIEQIKEAVIASKLQHALELLVDGTKNTNFEIESTLLISRFNEVEKDRSRDTISEETENRELNKIRIALLELLTEISNSFFDNEIIIDTPLLFESAFEVLTPKNDRVYSTSFSRSKVRCIAWELGLRFPKVASTLHYTLYWQIIGPNNKVNPKILCEFMLEDGWHDMWLVREWGFSEFGKWDTGSYQFILYRGEKSITEVSFIIETD